MRLALATASLILSLGSSAAFAGTSLCDADVNNTVNNCGFETGDTTGWTFSGAANVLAQNNLYGIDSYNPNSGAYDVFMGTQGATPGTHTTADNLYLSQGIALTESLTYTLSFYYDQDTPVSQGYTNYFAVIWDGVTVLSLNAINATNGYVFETLSLTGSASGANTLSFASQNDAGLWYLDDVTLDEVPEPASLAVFGLGLVGLSLARRARRGARG